MWKGLPFLCWKIFSIYSLYHFDGVDAFAHDLSHECLKGLRVLRDEESRLSFSYLGRPPLFLCALGDRFCRVEYELAWQYALKYRQHERVMRAGENNHAI